MGAERILVSISKGMRPPFILLLAHAKDLEKVKNFPDS